MTLKNNFYLLNVIKGGNSWDVLSTQCLAHSTYPINRGQGGGSHPGPRLALLIAFGEDVHVVQGLQEGLIVSRILVHHILDHLYCSSAQLPFL